MLGSLVTNLYRADVTSEIDGLVPPEVGSTIGDSLGSVGAQTADLAPGLAASVSQFANESFVDALSIGYLAAAGFIGIALLVAAHLIPKDIRRVQAEAPELHDSASDHESVGVLPVGAPALSASDAG